MRAVRQSCTSCVSLNKSTSPRENLHGHVTVSRDVLGKHKHGSQPDWDFTVLWLSRFRDFGTRRRSGLSGPERGGLSSCRAPQNISGRSRVPVYPVLAGTQFCSLLCRESRSRLSRFIVSVVVRITDLIMVKL